jgi:hypothetical protein
MPFICEHCGKEHRTQAELEGNGELEKGIEPPAIAKKARAKAKP